MHTRDHDEFMAESMRARMRLASEYGITLFVVDVHDRACPECQKYQGKVFSLEGKDPGYPVLGRTPPFHEGCRHGLLPYVPRPDSPEREEALQAFSLDENAFVYNLLEWHDVLAGGKAHNAPEDNPVYFLEKQRKKEERRRRKNSY